MKKVKNCEDLFASLSKNSKTNRCDERRKMTNMFKLLGIIPEDFVVRPCELHLWLEYFLIKIRKKE